MVQRIKQLRFSWPNRFSKKILLPLQSILVSYLRFAYVQPKTIFEVMFSLCKKCPNTEFFLVRIFPYFGRIWDLLRKYPYSARIWENTDQKKLHIWTLFTECLVSFHSNIQSTRRVNIHDNTETQIFTEMTKEI